MSKNLKRLLLAVGGLIALIAAGLAVGVFFLLRATEPIDIIDAEAPPYLTRRAALSEHRQQTSSPQHWEAESPPPGVLEIQYPSDGRSLKAWYRPSSEPLKPAIVFLHGGFAFGASDYTDLREFIEDGWAVLTPTLRGENGNPGSFEMFLGEVDDAANAIRWLAAQPQIDPDQIFVFGHSSGGVIASLVSLVPDLPVSLTGSAGGLYPEEMFIEYWADIAPFNTLSRESRRVRVLHPNITQMKRDHIAFVAAEDMILPFSREVAGVLPPKSFLKIREIEGDHITSLPEAFRRFKEAAAQTIAPTKRAAPQR